MSLIIYETHVDIAIVCATQISRYVSSGQKSEVQISDPAVLNHTCAFLNIPPGARHGKLDESKSCYEVFQLVLSEGFCESIHEHI